MSVRNCPTCRQDFTPSHGGRKYCSTRCLRMRPAEIARKKGTEQCSACKAPIRPNVSGLCFSCARAPKLIACPRCGKDFWPWEDRPSHARKFCGCKPIPKPRQPRPAPVYPVADCLWCGGVFPKRSRRQGCCSKACRCRYEVSKRKLILKGLTPQVVSPARIHRRDAGVCGLCGEHVDGRLRYPHPMSATVDHIVPVSRGGTQSDKNLQLAHARCNLLKGNRHAV